MLLEYFLGKLLPENFPWKLPTRAFLHPHNPSKITSTRNCVHWRLCSKKEIHRKLCLQKCFPHFSQKKLCPGRLIPRKCSYKSLLPTKLILWNTLLRIYSFVPAKCSYAKFIFKYWFPAKFSPNKNWNLHLEKSEPVKDVEYWFFLFLIIFYFAIFWLRW